MRPLRYRVLGPLQVFEGDRSLGLAGTKQRAVLALLLLNANRVVTTDRLVDDIWADEPPETAHNALQGYVSQLRKMLEPEVRGGDWQLLVREGLGYRLRVDPEHLDLHQFERLVAEGHAALASADPERAADRLRQALALWSGPPLTDFRQERFAVALRARLDEMRLAAIEDRIEADLARGHALELVGELEGLATEHPLRERLRGHLMIALYRSGRQAEALAAYQETRRRLIDELGIEPGPALQELQRQILTQDPALESGAREAVAVTLWSGEIGLLFTDIEGSTRLLEALGDRYPAVLSRHRKILREAAETCGGLEVDRQGDAFFFAFQNGIDATGAAAAGQRALANESWPSGHELRVRMGVHVGRPRILDGGYVGVDLHRAARICTAAHGGQVLVSEAVRARVGPAQGGWHFRELGTHELKGLSEPEVLHQLVIPGLPSDFPALRTGSGPRDVQRPDRSILAGISDPARLSELALLGALLAHARRPHELILARLARVAVGEPAQRELDAASAQLAAAHTDLSQRGVRSRVAAFTSSDPASDLLRLAERPEVDLVLVDAPVALLEDGQLGGDLERLLLDVPCDIAIWARGDEVAEFDRPPGEVYVPFGAAEHDWAALETAAWIAAAADATLYLLGTEADTDQGRRDASRLLADASLVVQRLADVAARPLLVEPGREGIASAVPDEEALLVVGLSDRWAQEGLGKVRWNLARTVNAPVLFVRHGLRPGGLSPSDSETRFTWSMSMGESRQPVQLQATAPPLRGQPA
jgi:DNA-binding SARP family transcriptional activator